MWPKAIGSEKPNFAVSFSNRLLVSVVKKVSNVFTLSTSGTRPPPSSVASLILLQEEKRTRELKNKAESEKDKLSFFTNKY